MTIEDMTEIMNEHFAELTRINKEVNRRNNRLFRAIKSVLGKSFERNLRALLEDCEVGSMLGVTTEFEISNNHGKSWVSENYGRKIKGYWVDQWAEGDSGDSWAGYIYVQLKPNKYLRAYFSC